MIAPRIAVILDENTSADGTTYEANKNYFQALAAQGARAYGIPYARDMAESILHDFDGYLSIGAGIAFPASWYSAPVGSPFKQSERLDIDCALMQAFLAANKPVLGICHGMQQLAALCDSKLRGDLSGTVHDGGAHEITLQPGTLLHTIIGQQSLTVNSRHKEAVHTLGPGVVASAAAPDGVIEAIELPG